MRVELLAIHQPAECRVVFDVVAEEVLWFAQRDSQTAELRIDVRLKPAALRSSIEP